MSECCGRCAMKCNEKLDLLAEQIEKMKKAGSTPRTVRMSQATYEAITGTELRVHDLHVFIDQSKRDGEMNIGE